MSEQNRKWLLRARPEAMVKASDFELATAPVPALSEGEVLVRNRWLSLEPAMRGWMEDRPNYIPPVGIGEVMRGMAIGEVVESKLAGFEAGDLVSGMLGWQEYAVADGNDVFFDNVGGSVLDAVLARIARGARVVICGAIERYSMDELPPGPRHYINLMIQRSRMEGFVILDYAPRFEEATKDLTAWVADGSIRWRVDVQHGFENAPETLRRLYTGANQGKQLLEF